MILTLMKFTCAINKHNFIAPHLSPYLYGEFLLRSQQGEIRYLNAIEDEAFDEVENLIHRFLPELGATANPVAALHAIFGLVACDPDSNGLPFIINEFPSCPHCGEREMCAWDIVEPPQAVDLPVQPVTHQEWQNLSENERAKVTYEALQTWLSNLKH